MGGSDDPTNLVELTIEQHAEAHRVLWEQYGKREDFLAWKSLSKQIDEEEIQQIRSSIGGKNNRGKQKTDNHRNKIRESLLGRDGIFFTEERRQKLSESMCGNNNFKKNWSEERRNQFSERMKRSHKENPRVIERDETGKIISTKCSRGVMEAASDLKSEVS